MSEFRDALAAWSTDRAPDRSATGTDHTADLVCNAIERYVGHIKRLRDIANR